MQGGAVLVKMNWLDGANTALRHPANCGSDAVVSAPKLGTKRPSCPILQPSTPFLAQNGLRVRFSKGDKTGLLHLEAI